jgi:spore coat polysaccharide biosynthesis protein SpsF (cytidylyltransferase family)
VIRVQGNFVSGNVVGNTSGAQWIINTISDTATMNNAFEDVVDNARIESEADGIIDFTENNPFGEP